MSDTLMTIIGIFIAVILMFILPLIIVANKHDQISQTVTQMAVSDFVDTVTKQGEITEFDYNKLIQKLYATGNSYDIEIEAQIIDDNPRRATTTLSSALTGEYKYYSVYTNTILDKIRENGKYELKKDDYITVTAKNSNVTVATILKNMFYKLTGKDTHTIGASAAQLVVNKSEAEGTEITTNPVTIHDGEKTVTVKSKRYTKVETLVPLPDSQMDSTDLKIKLVDYNANYKVTVTVNSQVYTVGETMPSYVIYNDAGTYVLDLKLVKEILNMNDDDWQNATITVDYVQG